MMTTTPTTGTGSPDTVQQTAVGHTGGDPLPAGRAPVGTGPSPLVAQLLALALVGLGVVAVQHLLVQLSAVQGPSWTVTTLEAADGVEGASPAVLAGAVVALVLGALLLPVALKPRPRKGLAVRAATGVHLRPKDLQRILDASLEGIDAVSDVDVRADRRKVRVRATSVAGKDRDAEITTTVRDRVEPVLATLERSPRVAVSVRHEEI